MLRRTCSIDVLLMKTGPSSSFIRIGTSFFRNTGYVGPPQRRSMLSRISTAVLSFPFISASMSAQLVRKTVTMRRIAPGQHVRMPVPIFVSLSLAAKASIFLSTILTMTTGG